METTMKTVRPQDWGLHHEEWRPHQFDAVQWVLQNQGSLILEAPTGSGKTSIAKAVSTRNRVVALCKTKNLQETNYGETYGFDVLFGKGNYNCVHPEYMKDNPTADDCVFPNMNKCPYAHQCPYLVAKGLAMSSDAASLNYAYYLSTQWAKQIPVGTLVLDEAHQLSDITLEWAGLTINEKIRSDYNLPSFPKIASLDVGLFANAERPIDQIRSWLVTSKNIVKGHLEEYLGVSRLTEKERAKARKLENMMKKLDATISALSSNESEWFIRSGYDVEHNYKTGTKEPGLICKPLTARYHWKRYFQHAETILMMSATIGNHSAFATELGIVDSYTYNSIPNQWPVDSRPIYDMGAPSMGRKATSYDFEKQARVIAKAIKELPEHWSGVIHVTRKTESTLLGQRLSKLGLGHRIWIPNHNTSTNIQMQEWAEVKQRNRKTGMIAICWTWWEGVDLTDERICIVAKTPYPFLGDEYERARQFYDGKTYLWRTATQMEQGLGRTRRGEAEDYDHDGIMEQFVGIADGSWKRVQSYLSESIREAIVKI